jgi:UDP-2,3-diacylglucosamine pyrophosphatase LpxH
MEKEKTRHFLGKIENFKDKKEKELEKKHLKAYLKGHKLFVHGRNIEGKPQYYITLFAWY